MPAPVVLAHVSQRGADAALCGHGMAAGREHLGQRRGLEAGLGESEGRAQTGTAGTDNDDVVAMVDEVVFAHALIPIRRIA